MIFFAMDPKTSARGFKCLCLNQWEAFIACKFVKRKFNGKHCLFTGLIKCLAAFNDGRRIVSGSKDQSLKIWDLISLQCCVTLKGHTDLIWRVAVASDDGFIVSASKDDMLKVSLFFPRQFFFQLGI